MTDDDLRFGDVSGSGGSNSDISDSLIQLVEVLIIGYVIIKKVIYSSTFQFHSSNHDTSVSHCSPHLLSDPKVPTEPIF